MSLCLRGKKCCLLNQGFVLGLKAFCLYIFERGNVYSNYEGLWETVILSIKKYAFLVIDFCLKQFYLQKKDQEKDKLKTNF